MKIINISGESREYEENGIIYEFPSPAKNPTTVPDELGERLIKTNQFMEFEVKKEKIKIKKEEIENGI
jgi:hypothetical protein